MIEQPPQPSDERRERIDSIGLTFDALRTFALLHPGADLEAAIDEAERQVKAELVAQSVSREPDATRCPHCSFSPTSLNDYCDKHRPSPAAHRPEPSAIQRWELLSGEPWMQKSIRGEWVKFSDIALASPSSAREEPPSRAVALDQFQRINDQSQIAFNVLMDERGKDGSGQ